MQSEAPRINFSSEYENYNRNIEEFNNYISTTMADIYKRLTLLGQSVHELDAIRRESVDPAYVAKLDVKINKLSSDLNGVISSFNSAVDKLNESYKDSFDKIGKVSSTLDAVSLNVGKLSGDLNKTIGNFNSVSQKINDKTDADSIVINNLNDSVAKLSDMVKANVNQLNSTDNELSEKLSKVSETVYSGLPAINGVVDDVNELKKLHSSINSRFESITNTSNALAVESNALNLKIDTVSKEFQNIQQGITDTQKHVMDFINIARSATSNISAFNPEALNVMIKKNEDRVETVEKEVSKVVEDHNNMEKNIASLSGRIADLSVVKNAAKLFDSVQAAAKSIEDSEARMNAQASKMEVMFNEVSSYMNKFVDINNRLNDLARRLEDSQNDFEKLKGNLSLFATKDDVIELHSKIENLSKGQP